MFRHEKRLVLWLLCCSNLAKAIFQNSKTNSRLVLNETILLNKLLYYSLFQIKGAVFKTLVTNGMFDNAHIRLTLTRGKKVISIVGCRSTIHLGSDVWSWNYSLYLSTKVICFSQVTSGMSPAFNLYGCTLIGNSSYHIATLLCLVYSHAYSLFFYFFFHFIFGSKIISN